MTSTVLVFAYGSNMWTPRLQARVPSAVRIGIGHVRGRRLAFHKRGADGSAKADAVRTDDEPDCVWGVLFEIARDDVAVLDAFEPSYDPIRVSVVVEKETIAATLYEARPHVVDRSLVPFTWYRDFVLHGAIEHDFPPEYVESIRAVPARRDPNRERERRNAAILRTDVSRER